MIRLQEVVEIFRGAVFDMLRQQPFVLQAQDGLGIRLPVNETRCLARSPSIRSAVRSTCCRTVVALTPLPIGSTSARRSAAAAHGPRRQALLRLPQNKAARQLPY
jgi:hypothetical protein